jgi:hypothetical protein
MRKLIVLISLVVIISGCKKEDQQLTEEDIKILNPFELEDSLLIKDTYIVYLNEENYPPILNEFSGTLKSFNSEELERTVIDKINAIEALGKKIGLNLDPEGIFVTSNSGFTFQDSDVEVIRKILAEIGREDFESVQYDFYMQNPRARMQNGGLPLPQNIRARMQGEPQWGYDYQNFTSKAVLYLGGGIVNDIIPEEKVWVIDSGIDANHKDLEGMVNLSLSKSFVGDGAPGNDFWGHGTAIAGLIAAIPANKYVPNNQDLIGMTGVSPGAELVSLKVFGSSSESKYSWVMKALEHVVRKGGSRGDIVNLSLGNRIRNCHQFGLFNVIKRMAKDAGIYFSISAGNAFDQRMPRPASEYLPACIDGENIFTIASFGIDYTTESIKFSYFSNFGIPPVDWAVPGYYIFTTYPENNKYAVMEGTSMSTGLMSGLIHLTNGVLRQKTTVSDSLGNVYNIPMK